MLRSLGFPITVLLLLFPCFLQAQEWQGKDVTFTHNGYKVIITVAEDSLLCDQLTKKYETTEKRYYSPRHVIATYDSIMSTLQGKVEFDWQESRWNKGYMYIKAITCRNGLKLITDHSMQIEKYYPDEDIIMLGSYQRLFNLSNGEDAYLVERTDKLNEGLTIVGAQYNGEYHEDGKLQLLVQCRNIYGRWETVVDLTELLDEPSRLDFYFVVKGKLYFLSYDEWWIVNFEKIKL